MCLSSNMFLNTIHTRLLSCVTFLKQHGSIVSPPLALPPFYPPPPPSCSQTCGFFLVKMVLTLQEMLTCVWAMQLVTAKGLTIRVINNVSKRMEVKPRFHEAFQKEGCPDAFPYRQKVPAPGLTIPCVTAWARCLFVVRMLSICKMAPFFARNCSQGQALEPSGQSCCPPGHVCVHIY